MNVKLRACVISGRRHRTFLSIHTVFNVLFTIETRVVVLCRFTD